MKVAVSVPRRNIAPCCAVQTTVPQVSPDRTGNPAYATVDTGICSRRDDGGKAPTDAQDSFHLNSLVAQILFFQLHEYAQDRYADSNFPGPKPLQTGVAWRSFSALFEPLNAIGRVKLFENLLRFANHEPYAPARGFFLAYAPLSFEHDVTGEYIGPGVWTEQGGSRAAAVRVRRTLKRWCEWLEALVHFQVHRQHYPVSPRLELDKTIIFLWPLLAHHKWGCGDLLRILQSLSADRFKVPFRSQSELAAYCWNVLRLRSRFGPPISGTLPGQPIAERLLRFLPMLH